MNKWWITGRLLLIYGLAFAFNVGHFSWGYRAGPLQIITSGLYVVAWVRFMWVNRLQKKRLTISAWMSVLTVLGGIIGLLARTLGGGFLSILGLLTAGISVTPLYGLLSLITDYDVFYLVAAVLGAVWLLISLWLSRRIA